MYKCLRCNTFLTEFDVLFNQKLNRPLDRCDCFRCSTKNRFDGKSYLEENRKIKYKNHLVPLINTACFLLLFGIAYLISPYMDSLGHSDPIREGTLYFFTVLACFFMLHMMFAWPICAWRVVKSFGNSYETADQSWTTYHVSSSSSGSVDVRKENHYSAGGTSYFTLENIFLFFTFPIWVLPHFVYLVMLKPKMDLERLSSEVPPQMIDAFVFAYKNTKPVRFPSASEKKYKSEEDTYKKESEKIEYKYSLLGIEEARRQLEKLPLPFVQVELEGKNYLLVLMIKEKENTFYYLLSRNNSQIIGTIFKNEYRVASNRDWKKEWTEEIDQWSALGKNVQKIVSNLDFYASKIK